MFATIQYCIVVIQCFGCKSANQVKYAKKRNAGYPRRDTGVTVSVAEPEPQGAASFWRRGSRSSNEMTMMMRLCNTGYSIFIRARFTSLLKYDVEKQEV
jgi:hypothetical protein